MKRKKIIIISFVIAITLIILYFTTGFFVIQPIGALPEGATVWYVRNNINLPFISSADGFLLKETGQVSLLTRSAAMGGIMDLINDKKIMRLPYMAFLYSISTGGVRFEK